MKKSKILHEDLDSAEEEEGDAADPAPMSDSESLAPERRPRQRGSKKIQSDDGGEASRQMQLLKEYAVPLKAMQEAARRLVKLDADNVPCVSNNPNKDDEQDSYTEDGKAAVTAAKEKAVAAYNAQLGILERALGKTAEHFNLACEKEYQEKQYKQQLRARQYYRKEEAAERRAHARMIEEDKMQHTKGYAERMERVRKLKRKKISSSETKKASVFDL
jgi:hypothetical protein